MAILNDLSQLNHVAKFLHLPLWQQRVIITAWLGFLLLCSGYYWLWPQWQKETRLKTELNQIEQKLVETQIHYDLLPFPNELAEKVIETAARLSQFYYTDHYSYKLTKTLNDHLSQSGSKLLVLKNQSVKNEAPFLINQWHLQLEGSYPQLIQFLLLLNQSAELFVFETMKINKESQQLQLDLTFSFYQLTVS